MGMVCKLDVLVLGMVKIRSQISPGELCNVLIVDNLYSDIKLRFTDYFVLENGRFSGGSVMVWV